MRQIIKLIGEKSDLELGYVEDGTYYETGLLADEAHSWKILNWIHTELEAGWHVIAVCRTQVNESMMDRSKRKNKEVLEKIVRAAFRHSKD